VLQYAYGSDRTNVPAAAAALAFGRVYVIRHAVVDYAVRGTHVKAFSAAYADPGYSIFLGIIQVNRIFCFVKFFVFQITRLSVFNGSGFLFCSDCSAGNVQ